MIHAYNKDEVDANTYTRTYIDALAEFDHSPYHLFLKVGLTDLLVADWKVENINDLEF